MPLEETLLIEGHDVQADLAVASRFATFLFALRNHPAINALRKKVEDSSTAREDLLRRSRVLAAREIDRRYQNTWDIPLAIYVWVLSQCDPTLGRLAARSVLDAPNLWWCRQVCDIVLAAPANEAATHLTQIANQVGQPVIVQLAPDSWDAVFEPGVHWEGSLVQAIAGPDRTASGNTFSHAVSLRAGRSSWLVSSAIEALEGAVA